MTPGLLTHQPMPRPAPAAPPARKRLRRLHQEVTAKLRIACALEHHAPERDGFRLETAAKLFCVTGLFYRHWFRTECFGLEKLPAGPMLLVANHGSHALAWDGANILTALLLDADPPRLVHGMADHRLMDLPVLGRCARRIGAVDGTRPACIRLLRAGATVLTFPEGTRALDRGFRQRYQLAPFGHGFMHVALATGAPIVPIAVIGPEEEAPLLANPRWLRRLLRTHVAPLTATVVVPLPVRYRIHFGAPLRFSGPATPRRVAHHVEQVRSAVTDLIQHGLAGRDSLFF
jgi:1-acyl-sn-glycerol-3-phosphate acyltransferase